VHSEREPAALDAVEECFGHHGRTNRGRLEVIELDAHSHRGFTGGQGVAQRQDARFFHEGDDPGRRQDRN
jgi:hypothetical protein